MRYVINPKYTNIRQRFDPFVKPTLKCYLSIGTHYELKSLLSLNNIGRKGSRQSEFSVAISEKGGSKVY